MIKKEVTKMKEVTYMEKEFNHTLICDVCGKEIYKGDSKQQLQNREGECYRVVKPVYGKAGVEDETVIHLCSEQCYNDYISKEFMRITRIPMYE